MSAVLLAIWMCRNYCQPTPKRTLYFLNFDTETFQAYSRKSIKVARTELDERDYAEVIAIVGRWESRTVRSRIDEGRIRLLIETREKTMALDAEGNLDINGYGRRLPVETVSFLNRFLERKGVFVPLKDGRTERSK